MSRGHFALISILLAVPDAARADAPAAPAPVQQPAQVQAQPPGPPPAAAPPAPVSQPPPLPSAQPMELHQQTAPAATPVQAPPMPAGQWTYTQQYGWLWMPYDQRYTQVIDNAATAYEYVYYPAFGWSWVLAPWVLGFGVPPYWGVLGPVHFAWYAHPWFRVGTAHLRPSWGPGFAAHGGFGHAVGRGGGWRSHR